MHEFGVILEFSQSYFGRSNLSYYMLGHNNHPQQKARGRKDGDVSMGNFRIMKKGFFGLPVFVVAICSVVIVFLIFRIFFTESSVNEMIDVDNGVIYGVSEGNNLDYRTEFPLEVTFNSGKDGEEISEAYYMESFGVNKMVFPYSYQLEDTYGLHTESLKEICTKGFYIDRGYKQIETEHAHQTKIKLYCYRDERLPESSIEIMIDAELSNRKVLKETQPELKHRLIISSYGFSDKYGDHRSTYTPDLWDDNNPRTLFLIINPEPIDGISFHQGISKQEFIKMINLEIKLLGIELEKHLKLNITNTYPEENAQSWINK